MHIMDHGYESLNGISLEVKTIIPDNYSKRLKNRRKNKTNIRMNFLLEILKANQIEYSTVNQHIFSVN